MQYCSPAWSPLVACCSSSLLACRIVPHIMSLRIASSDALISHVKFICAALCPTSGTSRCDAKLLLHTRVAGMQNKVRRMESWKKYVCTGTNNMQQLLNLLYQLNNIAVNKYLIAISEVLSLLTSTSGLAAIAMRPMPLCCRSNSTRG